MLKEPSVSECDKLIWISGSYVVLSAFFLHLIDTSCRILDNGFGVDVAMTEMSMSGIWLGKDIESCSSNSHSTVALFISISFSSDVD